MATDRPVEQGQPMPGSAQMLTHRDLPLPASSPFPADFPFDALMRAVCPLTGLRASLALANQQAEPDCVAALLPEAQLAAPRALAATRLAEQLVQTLRDVAHGGHARGSRVQALLQEYALSSQEGVALMCLAEALLRIPDDATRDALIRDKLACGDWQSHLGHRHTLFVHAASWALVLTGRLVASRTAAEADMAPRSLAATLTRMLAKGGEPLIRQGMDMAMRLMGEQFVAGETIAVALAQARAMQAKGFQHSYDMLGEAALTEADALRYLASYEQAIHAIGQAAGGRGVYAGPGISIKLSALHPRYERSQRDRVMAELAPRLIHLASLAHHYNIGLNIDAEESERLELSLDLLETLCNAPQLAGWSGIGFVVQAYQKRAPLVIEHLIALAQRSGHRLMVRLVKGAYWDSEIKRAQVAGLAAYPVYTRKAHTDISYLACARKLLAAPQAVFPQFATHNALTLASILQMAGPEFVLGCYEFQCLHGMGAPLYLALQQVLAAAGEPARPCRIYAPVGTHETLLAYLVRRLLENGANTSFVNQLADHALPLSQLLVDPVTQAQKTSPVGAPHPRIPLPGKLYAQPNLPKPPHLTESAAACLMPVRVAVPRHNAAGIDFANEIALQALAQALQSVKPPPPAQAWQAVAQLAGSSSPHTSLLPPVLRTEVLRNPANWQDGLGSMAEATPAQITQALQQARQAAPEWEAVPPLERAACLERAAALFERERATLMALAVREAGKTLPNALGEVREAVDFLSYYAAQLRLAAPHWQGARALGPVVCISPWNFPLAIFVGQIAAALAAGNVVLAKPAEQTPLIAMHAVALLHQAGIPTGALQCLPGRGESVGAALVAGGHEGRESHAEIHVESDKFFVTDAHRGQSVRHASEGPMTAERSQAEREVAASSVIRGVLFTGSTEVARGLHQQLAGHLDAWGHPVPLVAETGGQNAMIVDSSALPEQVVPDVLLSAFDSAGQRCSALRLLCLQEEIADRVLSLLRGALDECVLGDPARLETDIGPVIDTQAQATLEAHIAAMRASGHPVYRSPRHQALSAWSGSYVAPAMIELESVAELEREVFGPVLHVLRYRREALPALLEAIHATGYGLTMGLHTRIDETAHYLQRHARVGNLYINRNMIGAVVGVQPFGGEGRSGTGPKAGGPLTLTRLLAVCPPAVQAAWLPRASSPAPAWPSPAYEAAQALRGWLQQTGQAALLAWADRLAEHPIQPGGSWQLPGPTGERNDYSLQPRGMVWCVADRFPTLLAQTMAALLCGNTVQWGARVSEATLAGCGLPNRQLADAWSRLPERVQAAVSLAREVAAVSEEERRQGGLPEHLPQAVLYSGPAEHLRALCRVVARWPGPLVQVTVWQGEIRGAEAACFPLAELLRERVVSTNTAAVGGNASLLTSD